MLSIWKKKVFDLIDNNQEIMNDLNTYVNLVLQHNKHLNLTGFNEESIWNEGIYQSLFILKKYIKKNEQINLLDIGAGAGFPSIPFLIANRNCVKLTIIESLKKRIDFLSIVSDNLNLNINLINKRAEEVDLNESFDFITARAVSSLKNLIEISSSFGKINSTYIFPKSKKYQEELNEAKWIIDQLKISKIDVDKLNLNDNKEHIIITYKKTKNTPKHFPRKWNIINKKH